MSRFFEEYDSCPFYPGMVLEFTTRLIQWGIAAKKHLTISKPIVDVRFDCPKVDRKSICPLSQTRCPEKSIIERYIDTEHYRRRIAQEAGIYGPISLTIKPRIISQVTCPDGTIYKRSRGKGRLAGKWYKIPPGIRNVTEAIQKLGLEAVLVDSPPYECIKPKCEMWMSD